LHVAHCFVVQRRRGRQRVVESTQRVVQLVLAVGERTSLRRAERGREVLERIERRAEREGEDGLGIGGVGGGRDGGEAGGGEARDIADDSDVVG